MSTFGSDKKAQRPTKRSMKDKSKDFEKEESKVAKAFRDVDIQPSITDYATEGGHSTEPTINVIHTNQNTFKQR